MADKINKARRNFLFGAVRRFRKEDPDQPIAATADTVDVIRKANAAYVDGRWEEARDGYKEYIQSDKNDADVRYRLGVSLYRLGMYRQAKLEFERCLRLDREYRDAFLYLGLTMVRLERPEKAVPLWKRYFNTNAIPVQRELNLQLGLMESGVADPPETVAESVEQAIAQCGTAIG